jgi:hypothetical protein
MVRPGRSGRKQKAVYWAPLETSTSTGRKKVGATKTELEVRWEASQADALDGNGETILLDAQVKVYQDIGIGGLMWLGALTSLPSPPTNLYEVVTFEKVPNTKGTDYERWVGLQRYSDALPPTG